jgi:hypothetical protein
LPPPDGFYPAFLLRISRNGRIEMAPVCSDERNAPAPFFSEFCAIFFLAGIDRAEFAPYSTNVSSLLMELQKLNPCVSGAT